MRGLKDQMSPLANPQTTTVLATSTYLWLEAFNVAGNSTLTVPSKQFTIFIVKKWLNSKNSVLSYMTAHFVQ